MNDPHPLLAAMLANILAKHCGECDDKECTCNKDCNNSEKTAEVAFIHFDDEQSALAHAKGLASLKPGDVITCRMANRPDQHAVFLGFDIASGLVSTLVYESKVKAVVACTVPVSCISK